jgi:oxygen-independent coproporphyrinogen-3 oxidase
VKYWRRLPYVGLGLDAHSMLLAGEGAVRFQNTDDLDAYMGEGASAGPLGILQESVSRPEAEFIGREAAFEESLFLGLRMNDGVSLDALRESFGGVLMASVMPGLAEAREAGLLSAKDERVWLTAKGRMASNEVFSRLLVPAVG